MPRDKLQMPQVELRGSVRLENLSDVGSFLSSAVKVSMMSKSVEINYVLRPHLSTSWWGAFSNKSELTRS